ncbi:hypothetical protein [Streptomyces sp. TLI_105]|uniref:hypothetical protein n=1 Tax=Streptomyces sp. TLI_105 TaxID=1881019 RepID=UPI0015A54D64|nr:hypothetical protein [Streptomyces sp. TLI_105]
MEAARSTGIARRGQEGLDVDPEHLLARGVTSGADILCRLTTHPDPDRWPALVCGRHTHDDFTLFPCGRAEFLRKVILDEFDPYPISVGLCDASPRYVHRLEQQRCWKAGLDRYSGEPLSVDR